jgi:hypothetical protein
MLKTRKKKPAVLACFSEENRQKKAQLQQDEDFAHLSPGASAPDADGLESQPALSVLSRNHRDPASRPEAYHVETMIWPS